MKLIIGFVLGITSASAMAELDTSHYGSLPLLNKAFVLAGGVENGDMEKGKAHVLNMTPDGLVRAHCQ